MKKLVLSTEKIVIPDQLEHNDIIVVKRDGLVIATFQKHVNMFHGFDNNKRAYSNWPSIIQLLKKEYAGCEFLVFNENE